MCSESKKKCIYAVSKELGVGVDWKGLDKLSETEASQKIDKLKAQLDKTDTIPDDSSNIKTEQFNQWRFGMVVKIIFDKFPYGYLCANQKVFTEQVRKVYDLVAKAEILLKSRSESSSVVTEDVRGGE